MKKSMLLVLALCTSLPINAALLYVRNVTGKDITVKAGSQIKPIHPGQDVPFDIGTRINTFVVTYPDNTTESIGINDGYYRGTYYWDIVKEDGGYGAQPPSTD